MVGKTISHYKITEKLGQGGMGEVYLADDTKLKRQVAIKFLPEHLTKDKENVQRFEREAEAAAALNHPNIVTIHEIAEENDQTFIVMEYVDGKSLREKIDNKNLAVEEILNITNQICEGLTKAHNADIVHRDIKPENILIDNDGRVKILDFGLAKLKGVSKLTKETSTLGTIHYMSPEQIQGKDVDHRSDIWSLGVVLYELLTDEPPFKGEYESAVHYAILNEEPKLLKDIKSKYFLDIGKLLAKEPSNRFQNCKEVLRELDNIKPITPEKIKSKSKHAYIFSGVAVIITLILLYVLFFLPRDEDEKSLRSLAVLPFINERNDPDTDYLGMSLADEIIGGLSYLQNIIVRSSSSVRIYKDELIDPLSAGMELNADYILTGYHIRDGDIIRLNLELVDVHSNIIIWREQIEEHTEHIFKLIDTISERVINELRVEFSFAEDKRRKKDIPQNPLAYEFYLKSISYPLSLEGHLLAIEMLNKSIQIDSTYAPAYGELGFRIFRISQSSLENFDKYKDAERYLLKALSLNDELIEVYQQLSLLYAGIGKINKAMDLSYRAIAINPNSAVSHYSLSSILRSTGMLTESKKFAEKAIELNAKNPRFRALGVLYLYLGEYKKSFELFSLDKESAWSFQWRGLTLFREGKIDEAREYLLQAIKLEPEERVGLYASAVTAYMDNDIEQGLYYANQLDKAAPQDSEILYHLSGLFGLLGDTKSCVRNLKKAINRDFFNYPFILKDIFLDPVRNDPEFKEVLSFAKEKHEAFKKKYFSEEP